MTVKLDHILLGAPDLDTASSQFAALTGVTPATGGTHPGFGTRNRLVSLGPDVFFEVIAPDPAQEVGGKQRAEMIAGLSHPALLTFAIQTTDIDGLRARAEAAGLSTTGRVPMHRTRPDGVRLDWTVIRFTHPLYGETVPFGIDWQGSPHPATTSPSGCTLRHLTVLHPEPAGLEDIYRRLGLDVAVQGSLRPGFVVELDTPKGGVCFLGK
ncbi:Glyoxalase-like domain-containing protein [Rhizobiales bacterium GAS191]|jgi:hypothetical protein|nr:Glyoxalase-like domain-containing protein [Rhizobiales bacterium GAS113]SED92488.1 Glyoxalase-like domain-containing protein [Rhizobiales bacterium GAS191]SEE54757.1 Glyoxalase-like domain-containing protein [Rhizobiales bacterium GAS188]